MVIAGFILVFVFGLIVTEVRAAPRPRMERAAGVGSLRTLAWLRDGGRGAAGCGRTRRWQIEGGGGWGRVGGRAVGCVGGWKG